MTLMVSVCSQCGGDLLLHRETWDAVAEVFVGSLACPDCRRNYIDQRRPAETRPGAIPAVAPSPPPPPERTITMKSDDAHTDAPTHTRAYLKHLHEPTTYAVGIDADGLILAALDVTSELTKGGLCPHMLASLPLEGHIEDVQALQRERDQFDWFEPDCGNVHHLMRDLLAMERSYRDAASEFERADAVAKAAKKHMEAEGQRVHQLLAKVQDRRPLPLFEGLEGTTAA